MLTTVGFSLRNFNSRCIWHQEHHTQMQEVAISLQSDPCGETVSNYALFSEHLSFPGQNQCFSKSACQWEPKNSHKAFIQMCNKKIPKKCALVLPWHHICVECQPSGPSLQGAQTKVSRRLTSLKGCIYHTVEDTGSLQSFLQQCRQDRGSTRNHSSLKNKQFYVVIHIPRGLMWVSKKKLNLLKSLLLKFVHKISK